MNNRRLTDSICTFCFRCLVVFMMFVLPVIIIFASITKNNDRTVLYRLLDYSKETMVEKEKYFKLEQAPEFQIYPVNEHEFRVVYVDGKTIIRGAGDEGKRKVWEGK